MHDIEQQQVLPKLTFKVKNLSAYTKIVDGKSPNRKISIGSNIKKQSDKQKLVKGPWPISPTPVTYKYHKQPDSTGSSIIKQLPHSIMFQPSQKSQHQTKNYLSEGAIEKKQYAPRYLRQINFQSQQKQKQSSVPSIINPQNFTRRKQNPAIITNLSREQFSHQYRKSKDMTKKTRKGQISSQASHYRETTQRKPNQKSLYFIKYTQDQFKDFCQENCQKNSDRKMFYHPSNKVSKHSIDNQQAISEKISIYQQKQFKYNRVSSRKRLRNRVHYHINAANQYKFIMDPNLQIDKAQDSQLRKTILQSKSPTVKNMHTVGKIIKTNKKRKSEQINIDKSSPQLQGNHFLSMLQIQQVSLNSTSKQPKMKQEAGMIKNTIKNPNKFTSDVDLTEQITDQQNVTIQKSQRQQQNPKIHKPDFFVFKKPSDDDDNQNIFSLKTKVRKIKQLLIEAKQSLQVCFQLSGILLSPPTQKDSRKQIFEKVSKILKYLQLHTQILKIKKQCDCIVLAYERKNYQGQQQFQQFQDDQINNLCIIWHYDGRVYIGGFKSLQGDLQKSEKLSQQLLKHGMGFQWHPTQANQSSQIEGYVYYGQFKENLYEGYGIFKKYTQQLYIGLWQKGQKSGWGKLYNIKGQIESNGQFSEGKFIKSSV